MPSTHPPSPSAIDRFWDRFIDLARKKGVKKGALRWYVCHAERFLKVLEGKRLAEHTRQDVTGYLEGVGRIDRIQDWQFAQIVDAVEILHNLAGSLASDRGGLGLVAGFGSVSGYPPSDHCA